MIIEHLLEDNMIGDNLEDIMIRDHLLEDIMIIEHSLEEDIMNGDHDHSYQQLL